MVPCRKVYPLAAVVVFLAGLAGCGGRSNVVPVTGTLTYKGQPVPNARITFEPAHERQCFAETDEKGRFKIRYDKTLDGAPIGKHKVFVEYVPTTDAEREASLEGKPPRLSAEMKTFFNKYSPRSSKHRVEITRETRELNLNLD